MKIDYKDLILLNGELKKKQLRYHISYKTADQACIEPPGECCLTEDMRTRALQCIREYYQRKNMEVIFSQDDLYFSLKEQSR